MSILNGKMINFESFIKPGEKGTETKHMHVCLAAMVQLVVILRFKVVISSRIHRN